jgi:hypothetical protein
MTPAFSAGVVVGNSGTFYGTAAGNVDMDTTLDQWSISDTNRGIASAREQPGRRALQRFHRYLDPIAMRGARSN